MRATRWLIILDNQIGILGTPFLVQSALHRYLTQADVDMPLMERLLQLRGDDTSWNVLLWSPRVLTNYTVMLSESPWGRLLEDADVLMVGARFGSKVRIDFSLHAGGDRGMDFFNAKAQLFAGIFTIEYSLQSDAAQPRRIRDLSIDPGRVQGCIELPRSQFEEWGRQATRPHLYLVPRSISHGE